MSGSSRTVENATVIACAGRLTSENATSSREEIQAAIEELHPNVAFDMSAVTYVDSTGLSVLVSALKQARKMGGTAVLFALQPQVRALVELTQLHQIFPICDDEEAALATFESP